MDRQTVYPGQILPETVLLQMTKDAMIGLAKLSSFALGTSTIANGFAVTPTGPASLQVVVGAGEIYAPSVIDATAFSSLPADTTHTILKQGIMLDSSTVSCPAPTTTGQSINYLIEVAYQDQDSTPVLLPYYNSANPAMPYSGMGNNGLTQNTVRKGAAVIQVKPGASAATGSQVTPAPDAGYVGLYVVTVAYSQTTITSSNIAQYSGAPLLPSSIIQSIQTGNMSFALDTGAANAYVGAFSPAFTARAEGQVIRLKAKNANTGASTINDGVGSVSLVGAAHSALQGGEIVANGDIWAQWNSSVGAGSYVLLFCTGAPEQTAPATQSGHAVNAGQIQAQSLTAFTTAGTAPAFTLTPSPAITALAAGQRFRASFNAAGTTGSNTLNVNGLGAKNLLQYDSTGALVSAIISSGMLTDVEYNGTSFVVLDPLPAQVTNLVGIQGAFKNLTVSTTGTNAVVSITVDEIILENASGSYQTVRSVAVNPSLATSGISGLDTGTVAASTWYSVWVVWNSTNGAAGLLSLSATAPTLPGGWTHKARVGWVRTDATANKFPLGITQYGRIVQSLVAPSSNSTALPMLSSGNTSSVYTAISLAGFIPQTAKRICVVPVLTNASNIITVAPNASYGAALSTSNPPPMQEYSNTGGGSFNTPKWMSIESGNIYWATNGATNFIYMFGWEDNL